MSILSYVTPFVIIIKRYFTGKFDNVGIATGNLDETIGRVSVLRLHVHTESDNWAILSEVIIKLHNNLIKKKIKMRNYL